MAQYELVLVKNDSVSGVSYSEYTLQKPPATGYSLTQHPSTGALSWVQSFNNMGVVSAGYDTYTTPGYYTIPASPTYSNGPPGNNGILQVYTSNNGNILQIATIAPTTGSMFMWRRVFIPGSPGSWGSWSGLDMGSDFKNLNDAVCNHTFKHVQYEEGVEFNQADWSFTSELGGCYRIDKYSEYAYSGYCVDILPYNEYIAEMRVADIFPTIEVGDNVVTLFARSIPETFYADIRIIRAS